MPQLVTVRVRRLRLWFPVLPIMLLLSPLAPLVLVGWLAGCLATRIPPIPALRACWHLLRSLPGTDIDVALPGTEFLVRIR